MKFEEQGGDLGQAEPGAQVHRLDLDVVEDLDAGERDAELDRLDHGVDRALERVEAANRGRNLLGNAVQAQGHLGDDAERSFRADHQPGEIIAGGGLARPPGGADVAAVRRHHAQGQDRLAHRAVAHRIGARGAGRGHPAERGVGARIDREEQPHVAEIFVELLAANAGLDGAVEILGIDAEDRIHLRQIQADPPAHRGDIALHRRAGPEGNDRHLIEAAELHDLDHFLGRAREHHCVGQLRRELGLARAMLEADLLAELKSVAHDQPQLLDEAVGQRTPVVDKRVHDQNEKRTRAPIRRRSPTMPRSEAGRPASCSVVFSI